MSYSVQRGMPYWKACKIKKMKIEHAEINVEESGLDYLKQVRYATFICIKYGENSKEYQYALSQIKKKLARYMNALQQCYDAIHFDIKELMD